MSEVHTVGDGPLSQMTLDDLTVVSNSESKEEMKSNFDAEPKAKDGDEETEEDKAKKKRSKAASELGKAGGKAAAEARAAKEDEEPEKPEPKAKPKEADEDKEGDPRHDARARVMQATREAAEAKREARELKERLSRLEAQQIAKPAEAPARNPDAKPTPDQYETYEEYLEGLYDWKEQQKERQSSQRQREEADQTRLESLRSDYEQRTSGLKVKAEMEVESDPTLRSRVDSRLLELLTVTPPGMPATASSTVADEMADSEHPMRLAAYFSEHPDEVRRLVAMPNPRAIARAVALIEAKLDAGNGKAPEPAVSRAAPPVKPLGGSAQITDADLDDDTPFDQHYQIMQRQAEKARRGR